MSTDGKISTHARKQVRISGNADFQRVDKLKCEADAIMVGIGTILSDDPSLTVKSEELRKKRLDSRGDENPIRIVADSLAQTPVDSDIIRKGAGRRVILVSESAPIERLDGLRAAGATIVVVGRDRIDLGAALERLYGMGVRRLMVEGGGRLNWSMIREGLVDEIHVYIGNVVFGGDSSPTLADGDGFSDRSTACELELVSIEQMDGGVVLRWQVL